MQKHRAAPAVARLCGYQQKLCKALWTISLQPGQPVDATAILQAARFAAARHRASRFSLMMVRRAPCRPRTLPGFLRSSTPTKNASRSMNKPSERIVVFVTPAQKRAISATADNLGISVSELMRRAVLSFGATSEQVKAASIVDRLRAPREPDALNEALQRVARSSNRARQAAPAAPKPRAGSSAVSSAASSGVLRADASAESPADSSPAREPAASPENDAALDASGKLSQTLPPLGLARPADCAAVLAAVGMLESADDDNDAQVAARVAAAKAAAIAHDADTDDTPATGSDTRTPSRTATLLSSKRSAASKRQREHEEDEPDIDPTEGNGRFA
ncbi:plasmid mobilization protein [Paraburkholderia diazotrophica]|uniref:plasmid mobilization protein n=1 Tax=Paraburkholderia diazotrophica TaxID=667676 RepID=UPI00318036B3